MFRLSTFVAITLGVTAIASAGAPAAAFSSRPLVSAQLNRPDSSWINGPRVVAGPAARTTMGNAEMPVRIRSKSKK
jgi:hypothetical protein